MSDSFNPFTGKDARICSHTANKFRPDKTTGLNKFSLSILANNYKIDILWSLFAKRPINTGQESCGAVIDILIKTGPNLECEKFCRKSVINIRQAHSSEIDCIEIL